MIHRILHIILSFWLSLNLVFTVQGIAFTHCAHTGKVKLVLLQKNLAKKDCKPTSRCMNVTVEKPISILQQTSASFSLTPLMMLKPQTIVIFHPVAELKQGFFQTNHEARHGPPRQYLAFLRILLI